MQAKSKFSGNFTYLINIFRVNPAIFARTGAINSDMISIYVRQIIPVVPEPSAKVKRKFRAAEKWLFTLFNNPKAATHITNFLNPLADTGQQLITQVSQRKGRRILFSLKKDWDSDELPELPAFLSLYVR